MITADTPRTIRRMHADFESYGVFVAELRVGSIGERSGLPPGADLWGWTVGFHGLPGRHWIQGTAPDRATAEALWKDAWPRFCAARTSDDWNAGWQYIELSRRAE